MKILIITVVLLFSCEQTTQDDRNREAIIKSCDEEKADKAVGYYDAFRVTWKQHYALEKALDYCMYNGRIIDE